MGTKNDLTGQRFGRLVVLEDTGNRKYGRVVWLCRCDCGADSRVQSDRLRTGNTTSCGCYHREKVSEMGKKAKTHGMRNTKVYAAWRAMWNRTTNPRVKSYPRYGGRGIKVCDRWKTFEVFYEDMGNPLLEQSLDRIDVNGNYEPSNCRWATIKEQQNNVTTNVRVTFRGETKTAAEWNTLLGFPSNTVARRLRAGWTIERALLEPLDEVKAAAYKGGIISYKNAG